MINKLILYITLNYKDLEIKKFIDNIVIDLQFSRNFASIEYIKRRISNPMVDLSKSTFKKKILSNFVALGYN